MGQGCFRVWILNLFPYDLGSNKKQKSFDHNIASSAQEKSEIFCISFHLSSSSLYRIFLKSSPSKIQCSVALYVKLEGNEAEESVLEPVLGQPGGKTI